MGSAGGQGLTHLPKAARTEIRVPVERLSLHCVSLPAGPRRKALATLPFLLEEQLIDSPERYALLPLPAPQPADGRLLVAAVEQDWWRGVQAQLAGIKTSQLVWCIDFSSAGPARTAALREFCQSAGLDALVLQQEWRLWQQTRSPLRSALHDLRARAVWRPALNAAGALLALELLLTVGEWGGLAWQARQNTADIQQTARQIVGPQTALLNPAVQARRTLQARLHAAGQAGPDDFAPLLDAFSEDFAAAGGPERWQEVAYEAGRLRLVASLPATSASPLQQRLQAAGWQVTANPADGKLTLQVNRP